MNSTVPRLYFQPSATDTNLLYEVGIYEMDPLLYLKNGETSYLVVRDFEVPRLTKLNRFTNVLSFGEVSRWANGQAHGLLKTNDPQKLIPIFLKHFSISNVEVPYSFPSGILTSLESQGIHCSIMNHRFLSNRLIKTAAEIKNIETSMRAAEMAMRVVHTILKASKITGYQLKFRGKILTSEFLKEMIDEVLLKKNCIAIDKIVSCGEDAVEPHNQGAGPIRPHVPIIVDIFPRSSSHHYWGDITRTFVKGTPSKKIIELYRSVKKAQSTALSKLKPGVLCSTIHQSACASFESDHFETNERQGFIHGTGHGVGLDIHELPVLNASSTERLEAGHVVTIEPGLYYPGIGGIRIEDTVTITPTGYRNLTRYPKQFHVL